MTTFCRFALLFAGLSVLAGGEPTRIARVEAGLLPAVVVKGRPLPRFTITERLAHYAVPGVSIAVFDGGELAWARGYGVVEAGSAAPVTPSTLFQAASISKPVAAAGAMILVDRRQLALDETVGGKLRSWTLPESAAMKSEAVTLRRLLSHTAGLTVHGFRGYAADEPVPTLLQLLNGEPPANSKRIEVDITPGSRHRYSGGGYSVVQQLVIDITGQPFTAFMRDAVLKPAGMHESTYEQPLPAALAARAATGHRATGTPIAGRRHTYPEMAAAGLWTTPSDLVRFALAINRASSGAAGAFLSREAAGTMLSPQPASPGYGLGFALNGDEFGHGGSNEGFRCVLVAYRNGRGAAVMTNGDRGGELAREILNAISAEYGWTGYKPREREVATVAVAVLEAYTGEYQFPEWRAVVSLEQGGLVLSVPGQGRWDLLPEAEDRFFSPRPGLPPVIRFVRDDSGAVTAISGGGLNGRKVR